MNNFIDRLLTYCLTPVSWGYGGVVWVRNKLFDSGVMKQTAYKVPVISVGNITVGGTGKTPHVEYIVRHLADEFNIAVVSRGYKRKTKGYILANKRSTPEQIGDEPMQIYRKFGNKIKVAVCEDRRLGIDTLLETFPNIDLIILDDAFQHRWVLPKVSILLQDYNRPINEDKLLPLGRLREHGHSIYRADMIVVTKCPDHMNPIDYRVIYKKLDPMKFQKVYFSNFRYGELQPVFRESIRQMVSLSDLTAEDTVIIVSGIASPRTFVRHFKRYPFKVKVLRFPDHHDFTRSDLDMINDVFEKQKGKRNIIVTTEKDAVRMAYNPYFPSFLKTRTFFQPIQVEMKNAIEGDDFIYDLKSLIEKKEN